MNERQSGRPLFPIGGVWATPPALDLLDRTSTNANELLDRHQQGDWGVVCAADARSNENAINDGTRIISTYELGARRERVWIITEADRRTSTIMLSGDY